MRKTAWSKPSSSLPSDRLPSRPSSSASTHSSKGKGRNSNQKSSGPPKSAQVLRLEQQISDLRSSSLVDPDPKGGCFCQARNHDLSKFTPICMNCGLVLCVLNTPHYSCPHCCYPLISNATRDSLVVQLEEDVEATIVREVEERERKVEEARRAAGSFPTLASGLGASSPSSSMAGPPQPGKPPATAQTSHKVMSLTSTPGQKKKKVVIASYTPKPPPHSTDSSSTSATPVADPELERIPPPLGPREYSIGEWTRDERRPFRRLEGGALYVRPVHVRAENEGGGGGRSKRRKNKGKAKAGEAEGVVADDAAGEGGSGEGPEAGAS